jgi:hypothetical protein
MDDIYDINFRSKGEFCKICIRYNIIHDLYYTHAPLELLFHVKHDHINQHASSLT